jgi:hypothetical protein
VSQFLFFLTIFNVAAATLAWLWRRDAKAAETRSRRLLCDARQESMRSQRMLSDVRDLNAKTAEWLS